MRASDRERERVIAVLGRCAAEGRISFDTLTERTERAWTARTPDDLRALVADLPRERRVADLREAVAARLRRSIDRLRPAPAPIAISPPPAGALPRRMTLGRDPGCHLVLDDLSVSRRHAVLYGEGDSWVIADLGSRNGTRVNGWKVDRAVVGPGDEIELGGQRISFAPH